LSSEIALADIAYFIQSINTEYEFSNDTKWIVFGGSYAGSLAAWMRVKYAHLVHGAVSTSGPLLAQIDFQGIIMS
jgi:pimeloyl-ACP methyl ester carboxylesterase